MDTPAIKALRQKLTSTLQEAETLSAKTDATPEEVQRAGELVTEAESLQTQISAAQESAKKLQSIKTWHTTAATALPQPGEEPDETKAAGKSTINLLTGEIIDESGAGVLKTAMLKAVTNSNYSKSYADLLRAGGRIENVKSKDSVKFLSEGIDEDGGFFVPPEWMSGIISREPAPTRIVDMVRTASISRDKAKILKANYDIDDLYSSAVRVYKTSEGAAAAKSDKPAFGTFEVDVYSFTAELSITKELLEDTAFDIQGYLVEQLRIAYRNHCADKIIRGSGVGEHFGILTRAGTSHGPALVASGDASKVTFDGLQDIKFAVPEQYDQNCRWVFNKRSTARTIAKLVDDVKRPLWPVQAQAGMVNGEPASLLGYNYAYEAFMPNTEANALSIIFGDLTGYMRVFRLGMTIEPLREIEARQGRVVFLARFREGGDVAEPWRMKVQKIATSV